MARQRIQLAGKVNARLDELDNGAIFDLQNQVFTYLDNPGQIWCCRPDCNGRYESPYEMADHGLHCSDLISDIAPASSRVQLSVYRVLDDYGIGEYDQLARAIRAAVLRHADSPLVINLSLGFGPHVAQLANLLQDPAQFLNAPFGGAGASSLGAMSTAAAGNAARDLSMAAARYLFGQLPSTEVAGGSRQVVAIAAAGNDACPGQTRPAPRFPAIHEGVIGVGSIADAQGTLSSFTNLDDVYGTRNDGIGAYGEGIVGLHTAARFPQNQGPVWPWQSRRAINDTGWATWSGTSFATPIVSAIAALLLSRGASVADVQKWVEKETDVRAIAQT
jgi:subtilisin family serine protease